MRSERSSDRQNISDEDPCEPRMNIYARPGTLVVMKHPNSGYPVHQYLIQKHGLKLGVWYTVDRTVVEDFSTTVYLREYPGVAFNSVNFCDA